MVVCQHSLEGFRPDQRGISAENKYSPRITFQLAPRAGNGMAGAKLLFLQGKAYRYIAGQILFHPISLMTDDHDNPACSGILGSHNSPVKKWDTANFMEHLDQIGLHPGTFAGGQHHGCHILHTTPPLGKAVLLRE